MFAKDTNVWTTVAGWSPKGASGTGMCRAATDYCRGLCYHDKGCRKPIGEDNPDTGRWNHNNVIGGPAWKEPCQGLIQGRDAEQGACPAPERDPASTAKVRTCLRRRRKPMKKARRKTAAKTTSARSVPSVLCQLMSAQAGHHQFKSVVPATGGTR